ncbi:MAG: hypothetical protein HZC41_24385 [Chloroflexi bacterium]|nr:hypothetical protein [Chloroflexota bacterium]
MDTTYSERLVKLEFYPQWSALPELTGMVDPFDYQQRLAVYKRLIEVTNPRGICGQENELNVFWGYVFQYHWQWRSGRLRLANTPDGRIDPSSMWGYGNYTLSVIPLIAAMQAGLVPAMEILPPYSSSAVEYPCSSQDDSFQIPADLREAVQAWQAFFALMQRIEPGDDLEPLRFELWQAHHRSLTAAEAGIRTLGRQRASRSELDFLIGWIRMVDFLGAAAWRTDLVFMLEHGMGTLPERMLTEDDIPGHIADMDDQVNLNVRSILGLTRQSRLRYRFNLWLWQRAMRTRQARDAVLPMLDATFNPSPKNRNERRKLLRYMLAV